MTAKDITQIMNDHPELTAYGFLDPTHKDYASERSDLPNLLTECNDCVDYLLLQEKTKSVKKDGPTSYGWKHKVEKWCGRYISNGAFITAAIFLGFDLRKAGVNARMNLKEVN